MIANYGSYNIATYIIRIMKEKKNILKITEKLLLSDFFVKGKSLRVILEECYKIT